MKNHLVYLKGIENKTIVIRKGTYGLKMIERGKLCIEELEAAKKAIKKLIKKIGQVFLCVKAEYSYTKKPLAVRMGKGKGNIAGKEVIVREGKIILEVAGVSEILAKKALEQGQKKLSLRTSISSGRL